MELLRRFPDQNAVLAVFCAVSADPKICNFYVWGNESSRLFGQDTALTYDVASSATLVKLRGGGRALISSGDAASAPSGLANIVATFAPAERICFGTFLWGRCTCLVFLCRSSVFVVLRVSLWILGWAAGSMTMIFGTGKVNTNNCICYKWNMYI